MAGHTGLKKSRNLSSCVKIALAGLAALGSCATIVTWFQNQSANHPVPASLGTQVQVNNNVNAKIVLDSPRPVATTPPAPTATSPAHAATEQADAAILAGTDAVARNEGSALLTVRRARRPLSAGQHVRKREGESSLLALKARFTTRFYVHAGCVKLYHNGKPYRKENTEFTVCEGDGFPVYALNPASWSVLAIRDMDMEVESVEYGDLTKKT